MNGTGSRQVTKLALSTTMEQPLMAWHCSDAPRPDSKEGGQK